MSFIRGPLYVYCVLRMWYLVEYCNNFYLVLQKRQDVVDFLYEAASFDMDKVMTTVKQFFRDWSREVWLVTWHCIILRRHPQGADERGRCYGPIIEELRREFAENRVWAFSGMVVSFSLLFPSDLSSVSVLVPGSGLGRLAYEIAHHGYKCQGNEFSMYMLLASHFILNKWDICHSSTHSPTHSQTHSQTHSHTHSQTQHSLTHSLTHNTHSQTHGTHSQTHTLTQQLTHTQNSHTHSQTHTHIYRKQTPSAKPCVYKVVFTGKANNYDNVIASNAGTAYRIFVIPGSV